MDTESIRSAAKKSFWERPEGKTGLIIGSVLLFLLGFVLVANLGALVNFMNSAIGLAVTLAGLAGVVYMVLDPKMRNLVGYMYKSAMRWITGLFINMDPVAILKGYVDDLKTKQRQMNQQVNQLRGQMHKLNEVIVTNKREIENNLTLASKAKENNAESQVILKTRKAGRLQESNIKLEELHKKMGMMYRVLSKMYENATILIEDITDQVALKEQELKAIKASHTAMNSAMSIIKGDPDKRAMFEDAMEAIANDVAMKVGEMDRFMDLSANFMNSIDLQNGIFEEEGLRMLEQWEKETTNVLLGQDKQKLLDQVNTSDSLDLNTPRPEKQELPRQSDNTYDSLFD